jgi:alpha-galactosidase
MADPAVLSGLAPYAFPDPDVLHTGLFQTPAETTTEFSFWSLWGAPLLMATDPRNMTAFKASVVLNEDVLGIQRDALFARAVRLRADNATGAQLWYRDLAGGEAVALLYNRNDWAAQNLSVSWAELGGAWAGAGAGGVDVFDVWTKALAKAQAGGMQATDVPPHGVAMWRLSLPK